MRIDRRQVIARRQSDDRSPMYHRQRAGGTISPPFGWRANAAMALDLALVHVDRDHVDARSDGATAWIARELADARRDGGIAKDGNARDVGRNLLEQFQPFCRSIADSKA